MPKAARQRAETSIAILRSHVQTTTLYQSDVTYAPRELERAKAYARTAINTEEHIDARAAVP